MKTLLIANTEYGFHLVEVSAQPDNSAGYAECRDVLKSNIPGWENADLKDVMRLNAIVSNGVLTFRNVTL